MKSRLRFKVGYTVKSIEEAPGSKGDTACLYCGERRCEHRCLDLRCPPQNKDYPVFESPLTRDWGCNHFAFVEEYKNCRTCKHRSIYCEKSPGSMLLEIGLSAWRIKSLFDSGRKSFVCQPGASDCPGWEPKK
jgi:hypothetical protein